MILYEGYYLFRGNQRSFTKFFSTKNGTFGAEVAAKSGSFVSFFAVLEKCQRTVITDTVGLSCWINNKTPHISPVLTLSLLCFILWEWEYLSSAWLSKKYELKGEKLHLYVSTLQRGWRLVACSFHPVFGGFKFDPWVWIIKVLEKAGPLAGIFKGRFALTDCMSRSRPASAVGAAAAAASRLGVAPCLPTSPHIKSLPFSVIS